MDSATSPKPRLLTGWEAIAQYMGRVVRTVQRWEREMGLPVRRPHHINKKAILARTEDLDRWLTTQLPPRPANAGRKTARGYTNAVAHLAFLTVGNASGNSRCA